MIPFTAAAASAVPQNSPEPSPAHRAAPPPASVDVRPESLSFGSRVYNIPRNYLAGITRPQADNDYASFAIYVLLPDLSPRTPANSAEFDQPGWRDQLRALFEYKKVPRPKEEVLRFYLGFSKKSASDFRLIGGRYKLYELPNTAPHEIYTADTPNGLFLFTCEREREYKLPFFSPSCTVIEDFGNDVGAIYHFGRGHLMEAADIDAKLRGLVNSFAAK